MSPATAILKPHTKDLGGFQVRRLLPAFPQKMIGPFIFFDHMGPAQFRPNEGVDVRPHPHIGLATVTYLFEGALMHRDSLGTVQRIEPGDVNWMTAGGGIVHSERTPAEDRASGARLHGIQTWVALPLEDEQTAPGFAHLPRASLPAVSETGVDVHVIAGTAFGERAPTPVFSDTLYVAVTLAAGGSIGVPAEHEERGVYVVSGEVTIAGAAIEPYHVAVLPPGETVEVKAISPARLMLFGGQKMDGDRHIWWNFVASSRELMEAAKQRWRDMQFPPVPDETEFIPLPEDADRR
jgi:redox-sensitive bicupin YhaK (pirin superfamily)